MPSNISNVKSIALKKLAISCNFTANSDFLFQLKAEIASCEKILTKQKEIVNSKCY